MKTPRIVGVALVLSLLYQFSTPAFTPSTNSKGIAWVSESAEGWSGKAQTNALNATLHLAGAFDSSLDTTNHIGVTTHLGLLDPVAPLACTQNPDLTGDRLLNSADLLLLLDDINEHNLRSDFNCDGHTDHLDLYWWSQVWRSTIP